MIFSALKTQAQNMLNDVNIFITTSELETVLNEAQRLACLFTFCFEKYKVTADWGGVISANQHIFPVPSDCIAPIYVYDSDNQRRIYPAKLSQFELSGTTWESDTGANYQNYCIFDPTYNTPSTNNVETGCFRNHIMLVYPKVNTTSMQINMLYAASSPTLSNDSDILTVPPGYDSCLLDYVMFYAWTKRKSMQAMTEGLEKLRSFFDTISNLGEMVKSKYPQGRDFEPAPVESFLERFNLTYQTPRQAAQAAE